MSEQLLGLDFNLVWRHPVAYFRNDNLVEELHRRGCAGITSEAR